MTFLPRLNETLDTLRRRTGLMLVVMCLGLLLSAGLGMTQRPLYDSREVIEVSAPRLAGASAAAARGRLRGQVDGLMRAVLSDQALGQVIDAYDLFADRRGMTRRAQLDALRNAVRIELKAPGPEEPPRLLISARMPDAEQARLVAQELGHRLIRESVLLRIAEARATLDFYLARESGLIADLAEQERRIADFRTRHDAALAAGDPAGMDELARIDAAILAIDRARAAPGAGQSDAASDLDRRRAVLTAARRAQLRALAPPPALEQDYAALLHGLGNIMAQLDDTAQSRDAAEVDLMLETRHMSERLVVIEPAERAEAPVEDNRRAVAFGGGALSALVAVALALLLDWRNPVVRTTRQLRRLTEVGTIVSVPRAVPPARSTHDRTGPV
ncbi:hypothetical protein ACFO5X_04825 [Seohaeicola nanhaiensis]|uniref:Polysaccharide chain length determinant N-terminal domain-containing protein n=1 Tax=Seohaeicola nanhaiensis TaxID=1387282 RepID=A0ABV9KDA7_9RHOB